MTKTLPLNMHELRKYLPSDVRKEKLEDIAPFFFYDEKKIKAISNNLYSHLNHNSPFIFRNYFAVKANPNPTLMGLLIQENKGFFDASSPYELYLCENLKTKRKFFEKEVDIMFTSNNQKTSSYAYAIELNSIINFDSLCEFEKVKEAGLLNKVNRLSCRYNPGEKRKLEEAIIGNPGDSKFGMSEEQIFQLFEQFSGNNRGKSFGLHTMIGSNMLNVEEFSETSEMTFNLAKEIKQRYDINIEFINLGGGLGIPYRPNEKELDLTVLSDKIKNNYNNILTPLGLNPDIYFESGRYVMGPTGYLVASVISKKHHNGIDFVGLNVSTSAMPRTMLYGEKSYHHIEVITNGKKIFLSDTGIPQRLVGSKCENGDTFNYFNSLDNPNIEANVGDLVVIHDAGAHGISMADSYNGSLRPPEYLLTKDNKLELITRGETFEDLTRRHNF